mgnify:CR=1 FL=1
MKTVYILTNQAMPGIIKIGFTDNSVEQRMKELDKTATPIPFECYYAKRIDKAEFVEKKMHEAFDEFRIRDNREFFRMSPDQAKAALEIASGEDVTPKDDVVENESDRAALNRERNRNRFNFAQVGIEPGEILEFKKDPSITAKVIENDQIEFRGAKTSLSPAALIIVQEMGYKWTKIAGPQFWMYKGKTLYELNK